MEFESGDNVLIRNEDGNAPVVISVEIAGFEVKRMLFDNSNAIEVLSWGTYKKIGLKK